MSTKTKQRITNNILLLFNKASQGRGGRTRRVDTRERYAAVNPHHPHHPHHPHAAAQAQAQAQTQAQTQAQAPHAGPPQHQQPNSSTALILLTSALLLASETLPFVQDFKSNGIADAILSRYKDRK